MAVKLLSQPFVLSLMPLPDGTVSAADRAQLGVGYPLAATAPAPPVVPPVVTPEVVVAVPSAFRPLPADEHEPPIRFEIPPLIFSVNDRLLLASGEFILAIPTFGLKALVETAVCKDRAGASMIAQCRVVERVNMAEYGRIKRMTAVVESEDRIIMGCYHRALIELDDARLGLL